MLEGYLEEMREVEVRYADMLNSLHPDFKLSGTNLLHYLVLRRHDIRDLQNALHHLGLSSLASSESHIYQQVSQALRWLKAEAPGDKVVLDAFKGQALRKMHAEHLLGIHTEQELPHVMVTFSEEFLQRPEIVSTLLRNGMTIARINCAHGDKELWMEMINLLRKAIDSTGIACRIYMDIAGPKVRIASIINKKGKPKAKLKIEKGKRYWLVGDIEGKPAEDHRPAFIIDPAIALTGLKIGDRVIFDDGKAEGYVDLFEEGGRQIIINRRDEGNPRLKLEKGVNFPDSELPVSVLTDKDKEDLPFMCKHADMLGFSFVHHPDDLATLRKELNKSAQGAHPGIILKIERLSAVSNLPSLLLNGMQDKSLGVMIARGDLGVQIGFERMSEIQEEILWICEAAHVPVIWATQVLETLNKTGLPTRSEITDAAMGARSECVMLNKGKFVAEGVRSLKDILARQKEHVNKKRYMMRPLSIARNFLSE